MRNGIMFIVQNSIMSITRKRMPSMRNGMIPVMRKGMSIKYRGVIPIIRNGIMYVYVEYQANRKSDVVHK